MMRCVPMFIVTEKNIQEKQNIKIKQMNTDLIKHTIGACGEQCCQYEGFPTVTNAIIVIGVMFMIALIFKNKSYGKK